MNEKICRLCLQTISGNYQTIGQSLENILKLNIDISKEAVKCIECTNKLEVFLKFKSTCDYMKEQTVPTDLKDDIDLDPEKIETDNLISLMKSENETKCCFCMKPSETERLTSLNESKEHSFLVDVLKEHIPKLKENITEELLTCETCLDGLQVVLQFIINFLDVERKINEYIKIKGTDDKGQIELKSVQQFIFTPSIKFEVESKDVPELIENCDEIQEEDTMQADTEIKCEPETENSEMFIKTEDIEIKSHQSDSESSQESSILTGSNTEPLDISTPKSQTRQRKCSESTYKSSAEVVTRRCEICPYETKYPSHFKRHKLIHKSASELTMFKCNVCSYEAKRKGDLKRHKLTHETSSDTFKCESCPYVSIRRDTLNKHKLTHRSSSKVTFECKRCSYVAQDTYQLRQHRLLHRNPSDATIYRCDLCPHETKRQGYLKRHKLIHENCSQLAIFMCDLCPYEAKRKNDLKRHQLSHEGASKRTYICEHCSYVAKRLDHLKQHKLRHKNSSDVATFKCQLCPYVAHGDHHLRRHRLLHEDSPDVAAYECDRCSYQAKRSHDLKRHKLTHESTSKIMFECEHCSYVAKRMDHLKQHMVRHVSSSDVTAFRCELCPYVARHVDHLRQHKLLHKSSSDATVCK